MGDRLNVFKCIRCSRIFNRSYDLKRHYRRKRQCLLSWGQLADVPMDSLPVGWTKEMETWFRSRWDKMELNLWNRMEGLIDRMQDQYITMGHRRGMPSSYIPNGKYRHGFGEEDLSFLNSDDIIEILRSGSNILVMILRKIYFSDKYISNANVYCPNWRAKVVYVWEQDQEWHQVSFDDWWLSWIDQVEIWVGRWYQEHGEDRMVDYAVISKIFENIRSVNDWEQGVDDEEAIQNRNYGTMRRFVVRLQTSILHELCNHRGYYGEHFGVEQGNGDEDSFSSEEDEENEEARPKEE